MVSVFHIICLLIFICYSSSRFELRKQEFERIKDYELIHFDISELLETGILQFEVFGQYYKVELTTNHNLHPFEHQPSAPQSSCHYHGKVLNAEKSMVAISACEGSGIKGIIKAFGDELNIYPAKYYLDLEHPAFNNHHLTDEHLIYKSSNYDWHINDRKRDEDQLLGDMISSKNDGESIRSDITDDVHKRRMLYNNGNNVVELYTMCVKSYVDHWKEEGSDWYNEMKTYLAYIINLASAEYINGEWNTYDSNIDEISIRWVQLEVVEDWTVYYSSLYLSPGESYDSRTGNSAYMRKFRDWADDNKDLTDYDYGFLYAWRDDISGGVSWIGGICYTSSTSYKYGVCSSQGNDSRQRKILAHELGHNFGLQHDENDDGEDPYTCLDGDIMGDGDWNSGWSSCSYRYMRDHFQDQDNDMTCLESRTNNWRSNYEGDNGQDPNDPTPPPTLPPITGTLIYYDTLENWDINWDAGQNPDAISSSTYCANCVEIKGFDNEDNSITRATTITNMDYTEFTVLFDVILKNMESSNKCIISYKFDTDSSYIELRAIPGTGSTISLVSQTEIFSIDNSNANVLYVKLETLGDSSSGNDYCYYTNIGLYGIGSGNPVTDAPTKRPTSVPTTLSPTSNPVTTTTSDPNEVLLWYDSMNNYGDHWSYSSSVSSYDSSKCSRGDGMCTRIKGFVNTDNSIIRSTSISSRNYDSFTLTLDIVLSGMESINECIVWYKYDNDNYIQLFAQPGNSNGDIEYFLNTLLEIPTSSSSPNLLYIKLENNGDSSSGGDYCYFDEVELIGHVDTLNVITTPTTTEDNIIECVRIRRMTPFNGQWYEIDTINGRTAYEKNGLFLYTAIDSSDQLYWTISDTLGVDTLTNGYCVRTDVLNCDNAWSTDLNVEFIPCSTFEDESQLDPCLQNNPLSDAICLYHNMSSSNILNEIWNGWKTFDLVTDEGCIDNQPVYKYNDTDGNIFYLHYNEIKIQWIISMDNILNHGPFICHQSDLLKCIGGNWEYDYDYDDAVKFGIDDTMTVKICGNIVSENDEKANKPIMSKMVFTLLIVLGGCIVLISFGLILHLWSRKKTKKQRKEKVVKVINVDVNTTENVLEMNIEVPMETYQH